MDNEILKKIYHLVIAILVVVSFDLVFDLISITNTSSSTTTKESSSSSSDEYDVSMFKSLDIDGVLDLFDSKNTEVLYLGRSTCSACISFLPTLQSVQEEYGFTTNYLDITTVDTDSDSYTKFANKLTKTITPNVNGEEMSGKISEFFGYTPMVIIIKNGKAVDAIVGAYSEDSFKEFLNEYGIE